MDSKQNIREIQINFLHRQTDEQSLFKPTAPMLERWEVHIFALLKIILGIK